MKINEIKIKNYKGIESLRLEFDNGFRSNVVTLVGLNESGKTTILEAINDFYKLNRFEKNLDIIPKSRKGNFNDTVEIAFVCEITKEDTDLIDEFLHEHKLKYTSLPMNIEIRVRVYYRDSKYSMHKLGGEFVGEFKVRKGKSNKTVDFSSLEAVVEDFFWFIYDNLLPPVIYYPNFSETFPRAIYVEEDLTPIEGTLKNSYFTEVLTDILDSLEKGYELQTHIVDRIGVPDQEDSLNIVLNEMGKAITNAVFRNQDSPFFSTELLVRFKDRIISGKKVIEIKIYKDPEEYFPDQRSLGFRWFFAFVLFTEFRSKRKTDYGRRLFLLDEPASNLHSRAQEQALQILVNMSENNSLIYSTHSPHMIHPKWLEGVHIVINDAIKPSDGLSSEDSPTNVRTTPYRNFVAESLDQESYFKPILDCLEYRPSRLELVPKLIVVEGKGDFYCYSYFFTKQFIGEFDFRIYPSTGSTSSHFAVSMYLGWNRDFIVLLDSDHGGTSAKEKLLRKLGLVAEPFVYTLADVCETFNSYTLEDLIKEDVHKSIEVIGIEGNMSIKTKIARSFELLYATDHEFDFSDLVIARMRKVGDWLQNKLNQMEGRIVDVQ